MGESQPDVRIGNRRPDKAETVQVHLINVLQAVLVPSEGLSPDHLANEPAGKRDIIHFACSGYASGRVERRRSGRSSAARQSNAASDGRHTRSARTETRSLTRPPMFAADRPASGPRLRAGEWDWTRTRFNAGQPSGLGQDPARDAPDR